MSPDLRNQPFRKQRRQQPYIFFVKSWQLQTQNVSSKKQFQLFSLRTNTLSEISKLKGQSWPWRCGSLPRRRPSAPSSLYEWRTFPYEPKLCQHCSQLSSCGSQRWYRCRAPRRSSRSVVRSAFVTWGRLRPRRQPRGSCRARF